MDARGDHVEQSGADAGNDRGCDASLVGRTLVGVAIAFTVATPLLGVVYGSKSSPTDIYAGLEWLAATALSALGALLSWVVAGCYFAIRHVVRGHRVRRQAEPSERG